MRYTLKAPAESIFFTPANIVNDCAAECAIPIAESSHSVGIENFPRKREVEIFRKVWSDNAREVTKNFCDSPRMKPYPATSSVKFVIVLIKVDERVHEKIFVATFHPPIVSCSRLGVRDKPARNFFRGRR